MSNGDRDFGRGGSESLRGAAGGTDETQGNGAAAGWTRHTRDTQLSEDAAAIETSGGGGELVFIDTGVADWQTLADGVDPAAEIVLVGPDEDGMQVMADTLAGRSDIEAIHVIGHGDVGMFRLGTAEVTTDSLGQYADTFASIRDSLATQGDLMLYGCYVGADGRGQALVDQIAEATQADVAASDDLTGSEGLGGDWTLEVASGQIEAGPKLVERFQPFMMASLWPTNEEAHHVDRNHSPEI